jgi:hypothetical protein
MWNISCGKIIVEIALMNLRNISCQLGQSGVDLLLLVIGHLQQ